MHGIINVIICLFCVVVYDNNALVTKHHFYNKHKLTRRQDGSSGKSQKTAQKRQLTNNFVRKQGLPLSSTARPHILIQLKRPSSTQTQFIKSYAKYAVKALMNAISRLPSPARVPARPISTLLPPPPPVMINPKLNMTSLTDDSSMTSLADDSSPFESVMNKCVGIQGVNQDEVCLADHIKELVWSKEKNLNTALNRKLHITNENKFIDEVLQLMHADSSDMLETLNPDEQEVCRNTIAQVNGGQKRLLQAMTENDQVDMDRAAGEETMRKLAGITRLPLMSLSEDNDNVHITDLLTLKSKHNNINSKQQQLRKYHNDTTHTIASHDGDNTNMNRRRKSIMKLKSIADFYNLLLQQRRSRKNSSSSIGDKRDATYWYSQPHTPAQIKRIIQPILKCQNLVFNRPKKMDQEFHKRNGTSFRYNNNINTSNKKDEITDEISGDNIKSISENDVDKIITRVRKTGMKHSRKTRVHRHKKDKTLGKQKKGDFKIINISKKHRTTSKKQRRRKNKERQRVKRELDEIGDHTIELETYLRAYEEGDSLFASLDNGDFHFNLDDDINGHDFDPSDDVTSIISERSPRNSESLDDDIINTNDKKDTIEKRNYHVDLFLKKSSRPKALENEVALMRSANNMHDTSDVLRTFNKSIQLLASRNTETSGSGSGEPLYELRNLEDDGGASRAYALNPRFSHNRDKKDSLITRRGLIKRDLLRNSTKLRHNVTIPVFSLPPIDNKAINDDRSKMPIIKNYLHENESMAKFSPDSADELLENKTAVVNATNLTIPVNMALTNGNQIQNVSVQIPLIHSESVNGDLSAAFLGKLKSTNNNQKTLDLSVKMNNKTSANENDNNNNDDILPIYAIAPRSSPENETSLQLNPENITVENHTSRAIDPVNKTKVRDNNDLPFTKVDPKPKEDEENKNDDKKKNKKKQNHREKAMLSPIHESDDPLVNDTVGIDLKNASIENNVHSNENAHAINSLSSDISVGKQYTDSGNVQVLSYTDLKEKDLHSITSATIDTKDQLDNLVSISKHKPETLDKLITVTLNPEENHANERAPVAPVKKSFSSVRINDWTNGTHVITPSEASQVSNVKFTNAVLSSNENDVLKDKSIALMGAMLPKETNLTKSYKEKSNSSSSKDDSSSKTSAKEDIAPPLIENSTREDELKMHTDFQDALSFIENKQGEQLKAEFQDAIHSINFFTNATNSSDSVIDDSLASRTFGDDFASSSPASVLTPLVPNFSPTLPSATISKEFAENSKEDNKVQHNLSPSLAASWDRKDVLSNHPRASKNKDDDDDIDQVNHISKQNLTANSSDTKNIRTNAASLVKIQESFSDVFNVDKTADSNEFAAVTSKEPKEEDPDKKDRKRRPNNLHRFYQDSEILSRFSNRSLMSSRRSNFTDNTENGGAKDRIGSTKDSIFPMAPFFPDQPATSSDNLDSLFPYVFSDDNDGKTPKSLGISSVQNLGNNRLSSSTNTLRSGNDPFPNSFIHDAKSADSFDSLFPSDVFSSSTTPGETVTPAQSDSKFDLTDYPELQPYISGPANEKNNRLSSSSTASSSPRASSDSSDSNWNDLAAGTKRKTTNSNNNEFNGAAIDALFSSSDTSDPFKSLHRSSPSSSSSLQNNDIFDVPFFHNASTPVLDEPPPLLSSDTFEREITPGNETFFSSSKSRSPANSAAGFTPSGADSEDLIEPSLTASEIEQALQQQPPSTSLGFFSNESANPDSSYASYEPPPRAETPILEQRDTQSNQTSNNNAVASGPASGLAQQNVADTPTVASLLPASPINTDNPANADNFSQPIYGAGQSFTTPVDDAPFPVANRSTAEQETGEAFPPDTAFAKMNTTETDDYLLPSDFSSTGETVATPPVSPQSPLPPLSPQAPSPPIETETESAEAWVASQQVVNKPPPPPAPPALPAPAAPPLPPQGPPIPARLSSTPVEFSATTTEVLPAVPPGGRPLTVLPLAPGDTTPVEPPPQIRPQNNTGEPPIAFLPNYQITPLTDLKPDGTITPTVGQTTQGPIKSPPIQYNNITVGLTQDIQNALDSDPELSVTKPTTPHLFGPTIGVGAPSSPPFSFSKGMISATRMCKPGPQRPFYTGKPNCLIIGDSIALSYSYSVQAALRDDCFVQLSPASKGGVALDSEYGLQCIDMFLSTTDFTPTNFDVIVFNFGLHDIDVLSRFPEEYNNITFYAQNLRRIKQKLLSTGASVAFALSTPVPFDKAKDDMLREYNKAAESIMQETPFVTTVDLYSSVVRECGPVPFESCYMMKRDNDVHYGVVGSIMLGKQIASSIKFLLDKRNREAPRAQPANKYSELDSNSVVCPQPFTKCPAQSTCMENSDSRSGHACCPLRNAVDCKDLIHCCPQNTHCHPLCTDMSCSCIPIS